MKQGKNGVRRRYRSSADYVHAPGVAPRTVGAFPRITAHSNEDSTIFYRARSLVFGGNLDFKPSDRPRRNVELSARGSTGTLGAFPYSLARVLYADSCHSLHGLYCARYMCLPVSSSTDCIRTGLGILAISVSARGSSEIGIHDSDSAMFRREHVIARDGV